MRLRWRSVLLTVGSAFATAFADDAPVVRIRDGLLEPSSLTVHVAKSCDGSLRRDSR